MIQSLPGDIALAQGGGTRLMQYAAEAVVTGSPAVAFAAIVIRASRAGRIQAAVPAAGAVVARLTTTSSGSTLWPGGGGLILPQYRHETPPPAQLRSQVQHGTAFAVSSRHLYV